MKFKQAGTKTITKDLKLKDYSWRLKSVHCDFDTHMVDIEVLMKLTVAGALYVFTSKRAASIGYAFHTLANNKLRFVMFSATGSVLEIESTFTADTDWHSYTFTYDGSSNASGARLFKDAVEGHVVNGDNLTTSIDAGGEFKVGINGSNAFALNGRTGRELIYNRELTPAEVLANYNVLKTQAPHV